jgi:hypothetical protein
MTIAMSLTSIAKAFARPQVEFVEGADGRVLVMSMRHASDLVGYCALYEFDGIAADLTGADVVSLLGGDDGGVRSRLSKYAGSRFLSAKRPAAALAGGPRAKYDLFLPMFNHPYELLALNAVPGWRERSRVAVCYIVEAWIGKLPPYLADTLKGFDHVFIGVRGTVDEVAKISGRPCSYLPMGVDALRFCPSPNPALRAIDVSGIGRRSPVTHSALLAHGKRDRNFFYYYDSIQTAPSRSATRTITFRVSNPVEHRVLLANLLRRSRYFIANRAWVDQSAMVNGRDEIAARFYEGAAAGTVMIGEPPDSDHFREEFGWQDPVIPIPFDAPGIAGTLAELDSDPKRLARIRTDNVVHALLQHDWVNRIRPIVRFAGIPPSERLLAREARLRELAAEIRQVGVE